jgi:hypothetical protein
MTEFLKVISLLREQMHATLSRSDILRPLAWLIGMLLTATVGMAAGRAPNWLLVLMSIVLVAVIALYGTAYVFCLLKDRDALRSESYSLHKLAIEQGLLGDSTTGMFAPEAESSQRGITKQIEKKR